MRRSQSGGGPLVFDDGHHKFALAWHFMGDPEEVHAFIGATDGPDGVRFDAQSIISFRFPGNRIGNLEIVYSPDMELATRHYAQDDRVEITGTAGVLFINGGHGRLGATPPLTLYRDQTITSYDVPVRLGTELHPFDPSLPRGVAQRRAAGADREAGAAGAAFRARRGAIRPRGKSDPLVALGEEERWNDCTRNLFGTSAIFA